MRRLVAKLFVFSTLAASVAGQSAVAGKTAGMSLIRGATFEMGVDKAEIPALMEKFNVRHPQLFEEEVPRHTVNILSFYIDRTEVTNAEYKRFVDANPEWRKGRIAATLHNGKYLQHWKSDDPPEGMADHPVTNISWYAAAAYCQSLRKRLPTEAEWEYAARGGLKGRGFPWGDEMPDKSRGNFHLSGLKTTTSVGRYPANGYGLYDMAGNVWEFLTDEWRKYPLGPQTDPDAIFRIADLSSVKTRRALRGGSFDGAPINLRITYRDSHAPENAVPHVGFRCAMTAGKSK